MKVSSIVLLLGMLILTNACASDFVSIEIHVHEDGGVPVEDADVSGLFFTDQVVNRINLPNHKSVTDENGNAEVSGNDPRNVEIYVEKSGYYSSKGKINVREIDHTKVSILLRPKRNPIPMYAKSVKLIIPERNREFGFDFIAGDIVGAGYKGKRSDVQILFERNLGEDDTYVQTLKLRFSNPNDGFAKFERNKQWEASDFKTPYTATTNEYSSHLTVIKERTATGYRKNNFGVPFFLRIRSEVNGNGELESAQYCKIFPGIELFGVLLEQPRLRMTYYCNPTRNDRNLEFDPKNNLLTDLKPTEKVDRP